MDYKHKLGKNTKKQEESIITTQGLEQIVTKNRIKI